METYRTEQRLDGVNDMAQASLAERTVGSNDESTGLCRLGPNASLAEIVKQGNLRIQQAQRHARKGQKSHF